MRNNLNIILASILAIITILVFITWPEEPKEEKANAEQKLVITEMSYDKWVWHRRQGGYPVGMTRSEYNR